MLLQPMKATRKLIFLKTSVSYNSFFPQPYIVIKIKYVRNRDVFPFF